MIMHNTSRDGVCRRMLVHSVAKCFSHFPSNEVAALQLQATADEFAHWLVTEDKAR